MGRLIRDWNALTLSEQREFVISNEEIYTFERFQCKKLVNWGSVISNEGMDTLDCLSYILKHKMPRENMLFPTKGYTCLSVL